MTVKLLNVQMNTSTFDNLDPEYTNLNWNFSPFSVWQLNVMGLQCDFCNIKERDLKGLGFVILTEIPILQVFS